MRLPLQDDFMLVAASPNGGVGGTARMLFQMKKPEILAITLLIADYMNAIGRMNPGLLQAPATPKLGGGGSGPNRYFLENVCFLVFEGLHNRKLNLLSSSFLAHFFAVGSGV